ncbi:MAG: phosphatidate cytidylyltransferase [Bacteroidales bacterium]|nr:phosphatidate cytidylyltransferase [Bacteroidales bacterium]
MNPKTKNLLVRTAAGAVYVALMVAGTFCPPLMCGLMIAVSCIAVFEFGKLTSGPVDKLAQLFLMLLAVVLQICLLVSYYQHRGGWWLDDKGAIFSIFQGLVLSSLFAAAVFLTIRELFSANPCPIEHISKSVWGVLWIVIPLAAISTLSYVRPSDALAFFILIWANDTFAYLGGTLLGKHKMCPRISPGKTWEGTAVGCLMTMLLAWFLPLIPYFGSARPVHWDWILFALMTVVFGTFGDLLESLFKRNAGVKDSGNVMPGHGGMLDRFDSMLFAAVPALVYVMAYFISAAY